MNKVQVDRVGVAGDVPDLPLFSGAEGWVFRRRAVPGDGAFHLANKSITKVRSIRSTVVWPVDGIAQVVGRRLGRAQQGLQPPEFVHALEERHLAGAGRSPNARAEVDPGGAHISHAAERRHNIKGHDAVGFTEDLLSRDVAAEGRVAANVLHDDALAIKTRRTEVDHDVVA